MNPDKVLLLEQLVFQEMKTSFFLETEIEETIYFIRPNYSVSVPNTNRGVLLIS